MGSKRGSQSASGVSGIRSTSVLGDLVLVFLHFRLVVGMLEPVEHDLRSRLLELNHWKVEGSLIERCRLQHDLVLRVRDDPVHAVLEPVVSRELGDLNHQQLIGNRRLRTRDRVDLDPAVGLADELRDRERGQNAEDHDHNHEFDERERRTGAILKHAFLL